ncbi:MAG: hypothetical protein CMJ47_02815 [Planctomyces sp.]|nr:hypothetical protein [Planctomyces sp.]
MNISVFKPKRQKNYLCQWRDPATGKVRQKSTGTAIKRDAERFAARLEREIEEGNSIIGRRTRWEDFIVRYKVERLAKRKANTRIKFDALVAMLEKTIAPKYVQGITTEEIARFIQQLRELGRSEATIKGYLAYLKSMLRWAKDKRVISVVPHIEMPDAPDKMRGRPIVAEEFERMLEAVPLVVGDECAESWRFFLRGLWWSGLRLMEATRLHWTDDTYLTIDTTRAVPLFKISAEADKGGKSRLFPIAPEFADQLASIPENDRTGFVFNPQLPSISRRPDPRYIGRVITSIGKQAKVKVSATGKPASAHDLRRAFGERWSRVLMPQDLKEAMRHSSINTTLAFYVGDTPEKTSQAMFAAHSTGKTTGSSFESKPPKGRKTVG